MKCPLCNTEYEEQSPKKLLFFVRGPLDEGTAWVEVWDREKVVDFVKSALETAKVEDRSFDSLRVEFHKESGEFSVVSWGEESPGVTFDDYGLQKGLLVELDGKEVFNDLEPIDDD